MTLSTRFPLLAAAILLPLGLAACVDLDESASLGGAASSGSQACLDAVRAQTSNPNVTLLDERSSEAGTTYVFSVGPQGAEWTCASDGRGNTSVMSMTDKGSL